jgi:N-hydroxyarylamine O-acetyltransferase
MSNDAFDVDAWFRRIGYSGPRDPSLPTLRAVIEAHTATIPFENIDVLLGRTPRLDLRSLQDKLIASERGGYCFEQNTLLHSGLTALGFQVTRLLARVIRGMAADASGPATHMLLRVDLPEGPYLADVGFGNQTPTAPLKFRPMEEQRTPHDVMRLFPVGDELTLQARIGQARIGQARIGQAEIEPDGDWQSIYRLSPHPRLPVDFEVANWFTATHPASPFVSHLIVARPGRDATRHTLFNGRVTVRGPEGRVERFTLDREAEFPEALKDRFGVTLNGGDLAEALAILDRKGTRDAQHPFFG